VQVRASIFLSYVCVPVCYVCACGLVCIYMCVSVCHMYVCLFVVCLRVG